MEPVGVGLRAVATIIDTAILMALAYAIAAATGGTSAEGFHIEGGPFFIWLVIAIGYYTVMEALGGATVGKRVLRLKVVKAEGAAIDWQASIVRNVLRIVDGLFFYLVAAIFVWS